MLCFFCVTKYSTSICSCRERTRGAGGAEPDLPAQAAVPPLLLPLRSCRQGHCVQVLLTYTLPSTFFLMWNNCPASTFIGIVITGFGFVGINILLQSSPVLLIWSRIDLALRALVLGIQIRIRIQEQWNRTKFTRKTWFPAFHKGFCTYLNRYVLWPTTYVKYIFIFHF